MAGRRDSARGEQQTEEVDQTKDDEPNQQEQRWAVGDRRADQRAESCRDPEQQREHDEDAPLQRTRHAPRQVLDPHPSAAMGSSCGTDREPGLAGRRTG